MASLDDVPEAAARASVRLRDELLAILGDDLVGAWLHGGTTFPDRPAHPGDFDICAVVANVTPSERAPRRWRSDPGSRPSRIKAAEEAIERQLGVIFDTGYLPADEVGRRAPPSMAFDRGRRETAWAVYRAHWLAGQHVPLHGAGPEGLVVPPTGAELRRALDREIEHLERHVLEGDAAVPYEATYAIWNGCRILCAIQTGSPVISKRSAGTWALRHVPERWHEAIRAAGRSYDGVADAADVEILREAMPPFVAMVRERLPTTTRRKGSARWS